MMAENGIMMDFRMDLDLELGKKGYDELLDRYCTRIVPA
jgi:hypothetical protein